MTFQTINIMKKAFLLGAMVCALGMMTACKSGTANENTNDTLQPANEVVSIEPPTETGNGPIWGELERLKDKISGGSTVDGSANDLKKAYPQYTWGESRLLNYSNQAPPAMGGASVFPVKSSRTFLTPSAKSNTTMAGTIQHHALAHK